MPLCRSFGPVVAAVITLFASRSWALGGQGDPCDSTPCEPDLYCQDGYCCNTRCDRGCEACNNEGQWGVCTPRKRYTQGRTECGYFLCLDSPYCNRSCDGMDAECVKGSYCNINKCIKQQPGGTACRRNAECESEVCAVAVVGSSGVCCDRACNGGPCESCLNALTGKDDGLCGNVLSFADKGPLVCQVDMSPCGHTGYCDGMGQCAYREKGFRVGTTCAPEDGGVFASITQTCDGRGSTSCEVLVCQGTCQDGMGCRDAGCAGDSSRENVDGGADSGSPSNDAAAPCYPYAPVDGACLESCKRQSDCELPAQCFRDGKCHGGRTGERCWWGNGDAGVFDHDGGCVAGVPEDPLEVIGACSAAPRRGGASYWPELLALFGLCWMRRRGV